MKPRRIEPGPGQESVWDYPRPPRLEDVPQRIRVVFNGVTIADTQRAKRVLETSHPPTYYIPPEDIHMEYIVLEPGGKTFCEWKGQASYYTVRVNNKEAPRAAWTYANPTPDFTPIKGYITFYPAPMDTCYVGDEQVQSQAGSYYGGWITSMVVGPFKGEPGTWGW
jgi:uncharacterized protein (DUF427 family)